MQMQQSQKYKKIFSPPKKKLRFKPRPTSQLPFKKKKQIWNLLDFFTGNQAASIAFCWSIDPWRTKKTLKKWQSFRGIHTP